MKRKQKKAIGASERGGLSAEVRRATHREHAEKKRTDAHPEPPASVAEICRRIGCGRGTVYRYAEYPDAPPLTNLAALETFVREHYEPRRAATEARAEQLHWRAELLRLQYERTMAGLIPKEEAERTQREMCAIVRFHGRGLAEILCARLRPGQTMPDMAAIIGEETIRTMRTLSTSTDADDKEILQRCGMSPHKPTEEGQSR